MGSSIILGMVGFGKLYLMYLEDMTGNIVLKVRSGYSTCPIGQSLKCVKVIIKSVFLSMYNSPLEC